MASEADATESVAEAAAATNSWREVAGRLEQLRLQDVEWSSCDKMGELLGCCASTVHKAVTHGSSDLQDWARQLPGDPKRIRTYSDKRNELALDSAVSRELSPEENVIVREFFENASPDDRARMHLMSPQEQLDYVKRRAD
jgi:hypothetical protein